MKLFQIQIEFLGFSIVKNTITPKNRVIDFGSKFPDKILDKTQLQRFLGCLNYVTDFYKNLAEDRAILEERLKKNPRPWTEAHTFAVRRIKRRIQTLPCLILCNESALKIVQMDASNEGYGGILLQNPEIDPSVIEKTDHYTNSKNILH